MRSKEEPAKKNWFKRHPILTTFLALFLIGLIFSSDSSPTSNPEEQRARIDQINTQKDVVSNTPSSYKLGQRFVWGDFAYTFHKVETTSQIGKDIYGEFYGEKADGIFLVVDVTIENIAKETKDYWGGAISITDSQGRVFEDDDNAWIYLDEDVKFIYEQLQPNLPKRGKIVFDVPKDIEGNLRIKKSLFSSDYTYVSWK